MNFAPDKIQSGEKSPRKCIYSVPAQKTAKHCAKFGWLAVSDVAAVKAKFHYAVWSQTGPKMVADLQRAGIWPII